MEYQGDALGIAITWPMHDELLPGDIPVAGSQSGMTSWAFRWTQDDCPILEVVDAVNPADLGLMTGCVVPYDPADETLAVMGVYGEDVATIAVVGPTGFFLETDGEVVVQCGSEFNDPAWKDSSICVIAMPTGITVEFQATAAETREPIGRPVTIRVEDGKLHMT